VSIKGYKVFNPDWTCRGFQYEVGKTFKHDGNIEMCGAGFHFCRKVSDCFNYYGFNSNNKVAEVEAIGNVETKGDKSVTDEIVILRELTWHEVLDLANTGKDCTGNRNSGNRNSGNCNSGNRNSGDYNSGNCNSGNRNSGDYNSGNCNSGDYNSGDYNSGNCNSGNRNSGDYNSGNCNSGNCNSGDYNSGNCNSGNCNSGDYNSGDYNSGNRNSGDYNSGNCNSGDYNSGDYNSGNWNSGNRNSGDYNSGNCNSGNWNSGDWNSGDFSTGFFNSIEQPLCAFNKPLDIDRNAFNSNLAVRAMDWKYENDWWIYSENMTAEEKEAHPEHETTGGYLKSVDFKTACGIMWDNMTEDERVAVKDIPNFDASVFEEITGIKVV